MAILNQLLQTLDGAIIVPNTDLLAHATAQEGSETREVLDMLRLMTSNNVKIVIAAAGVGRSYVTELEQTDACVKLRVGHASNGYRYGRGVTSKGRR